jgi:hypothetical protein
MKKLDIPLILIIISIAIVILFFTAPNCDDIHDSVISSIFSSIIALFIITSSFVCVIGILMSNKSESKVLFLIWYIFSIIAFSASILIVSLFFINRFF